MDFLDKLINAARNILPGKKGIFLNIRDFAHEKCLKAEDFLATKELADFVKTDKYSAAVEFTDKCGLHQFKDLNVSRPSGSLADVGMKALSVNCNLSVIELAASEKLHITTAKDFYKYQKPQKNKLEETYLRYSPENVEKLSKQSSGERIILMKFSAPDTKGNYGLIGSYEIENLTRTGLANKIKDLGDAVNALQKANETVNTKFQFVQTSNLSLNKQKEKAPGTDIEMMLGAQKNVNKNPFVEIGGFKGGLN